MSYKGIMGFEICQLAAQILGAPALVSTAIAGINVEKEAVATLVGWRIDV